MLKKKPISPVLRDREGTVMVLFALLLPVLFILSAIAINLARVELTRTELQIATDVATRAGGTAWTRTGEIGPATYFALVAADLNTVQGEQVDFDEDNIVYGFNATRSNNGRGRFEFVPNEDGDSIDLITAIQVEGRVDANLFFEIAGIRSIGTRADSVTSQVDRDIMLVVDRSGSMAYFENEQFLFNTITELYNDGNNGFGISGRDYIDAVNDFQGPTTFDASDPDSPVPANLNTVDIADLMQSLGFPGNRRTLPSLALNDRFYEDSVRNAIAAALANAQAAGDPVRQDRLADLLVYTQTLNANYNPDNGARTAAPEQSRWAVLVQAVDAFTAVLESTRLQEQVGVVSFSNTALVELRLKKNLALPVERIDDTIPTGGTAIGVGMNRGADVLIEDRRLNAIPTMVVLSDGENRSGVSPLVAVADIKAKYPFMVVNTVTFADGNQEEMMEVADLGGGEHYHANDGDELREVFEEIARSFSTVITD